MRKSAVPSIIPHPEHTHRLSPRVQPPNCAPRRKNILRMNLFASAILAVTLLAPQFARAQASEIPSAAPPQAAGNSEQRGRALIDQMIAALGGDAWLKRTTMSAQGRTATFFQGRPNPGVDYANEYRRFATPASAAGPALPDALRQNFLGDRGMIMPGKITSVVHIWLDGHGYEVTYKGKTELPKEQVEGHYRNAAHSIEEIVHSWIDAPGVMIIAEGSGMVERHIVDKVTVLTANNDAVTLELDSTTHLPLRRTYQWRNPQFNDFDEEVETFDDYHTIQGLPTALTLTLYHNDDMTNQRYLTNVVYNAPLSPDLFNPDLPLSKKK
jgi:hypothetical protein